MFRNSFQGSDSVHIIGPLSLDKHAELKRIFSGAIKCVYLDKLRSHVIQMSLGTKKISYHSRPLSLALNQENLVIQAYLEPQGSLSIDLVLIDSSHCRRKIRFCSGRKSLSVLPALIQAPLRDLRLSTWVNLCLPVSQLIREFWAGQSFKLLDGICLSGNCYIREIFTTRFPLSETSVPLEDFKSIPKSFRFPVAMENINQTFGADRILKQRDEQIEPTRDTLDGTTTTTVAIATPIPVKRITVKDIFEMGKIPGSAVFATADVFRYRMKTAGESEEIKLARVVPRRFRLCSRGEKRSEENLSVAGRSAVAHFAQVPELLALEHQIEVTLRGPDELVLSERTSDDLSLMVDSKFFYSYATRRVFPLAY